MKRSIPSNKSLVDNAVIDIADFQLLPIFQLLGTDFSNKIFKKEEIFFCYRILQKAIDAFIARKFSYFDAHTTTNCCHGMAIYVTNLLHKVSNLNLYEIRFEAEKFLASLPEKTNESANQQLRSWYLPQPLIDLVSIYILAFAKEQDPIKGTRTKKEKLKEIAPLSTKFCNKVINCLQDTFSNSIALSYQFLHSEIDSTCVINSFFIDVWAKYVRESFLRSDKRGIKYAPCLFSMQVSIAYLLQNKAIIAIILDSLDQNLFLNRRKVQLLKSNGKSFKSITIDELEFYDKAAPIIVFGGCSFTEMNCEKFNNAIEPWINDFPSLILACDVFYPQFPEVKDDPFFDSSPVEVEEENLKNKLQEFAKLKGFSSCDPSLFCLAHVYPASIFEIRKCINETNTESLPISSVPLKKIPLSFFKKELLVK